MMKKTTGEVTIMKRILSLLLAVLLIFLSVEKDIGKKQEEIAARREN